MAAEAEYDNDNDDDDDDDDIDDSPALNKDDVLWAGTKRRQYGLSTANHNNVLKKAVPYFQALIVTGAEGIFSSPWPEYNITNLSNMMGKAWTDVCRQLARRHRLRPIGVGAVPTPNEARKVRSDPA